MRVDKSACLAMNKSLSYPTSYTLARLGQK